MPDALNLQEALSKVASMTDAEYRTVVFVKLAEIEHGMTDLVGNGQPGRIDRIEGKLRWHDKVIWMALGIVGFVTVAIQLVRVAVW